MVTTEAYRLHAGAVGVGSAEHSDNAVLIVSSEMPGDVREAIVGSENADATQKPRRGATAATVSGLLLIALATAVFVGGCSVNKFVLNQAAGGFVDFFNTPSSTGGELTQLSERVFTFNWYFDRTLIVRTDVGLVVVDSFNEHLVRELKQALAADATSPIFIFCLPALGP